MHMFVFYLRRLVKVFPYNCWGLVRLVFSYLSFRYIILKFLVFSFHILCYKSNYIFIYTCTSTMTYSVSKCLVSGLYLISLYNPSMVSWLTPGCVCVNIKKEKSRSINFNKWEKLSIIKAKDNCSDSHTINRRLLLFVSISAKMYLKCDYYVKFNFSINHLLEHRCILMDYSLL